MNPNPTQKEMFEAAQKLKERQVEREQTLVVAHTRADVDTYFDTYKKWQATDEDIDELRRQTDGS